MELKPGYKLTEVGVIPEDWEVKSVKEFAVIKTGPFGTVLKAAEYSLGNGVPLISVGEIRSGFLNITDNTPRVPEAVLRRLPQYVLRTGDIVFGRKGGVERSALIRKQQDGWFLGSDGISIRPSRQCHPAYLAMQFQSDRVREWLINNSIGTTMPSLNQQVLSNIAVPLPPTKAEQEAIAEALSDADALIESLEQLIAKKRLLKKGAMQELLTGKRRLQGFGEKTIGYKQIEVGVIPADWETHPLRDGVTLLSGQHVLARHCNTDGNGVPYITGPADFVEGIIQHTRLTTKPGTMCRPNDVLVTVKGSGAGTLALSNASYCISRQLMAIRVTEWDTRYVYFSLLQDALLFGAAATGLIPGLSRGDILSKLLRLPPARPEQEAISGALSDMDAEIAALEAKLAKARQIKQGMMHNLLTGKIRLV